MSKKRILVITGLALVVLVVAVGVVVFWPKIKNVAGELTDHRTENEEAANGALPGDVTLYAKEFQASANYASPGYYPSLNGAEVADAQRSEPYPQATFGGSHSEPNVVFAHRSQDTYQGTSFINHRKPGETFLLGGDSPPLKGVVPPGPYVAKVDPSTGVQLWRTYLDNANVSQRWIAMCNFNILASGKIVIAWGNTVVLIDPETGRILKSNTLPTGEVPVADCHFKHVTVAPDGTIILKNQNRPIGETGQGSMAMIVGMHQGLKQPNSSYVAVDPDTLDVLDRIELPESAPSPHVITMFEGKIAIYAAAQVHAYRYFWDPKEKKLSQDKSWVVSFPAKGQQFAACPGVMGEWIVIQTNGGLSKEAASSVVAINQKEPGRMTSVYPFGDQLKPGEISWAPPKTACDIENNMVYSADVGMGKVGGIKLDQATGELKTVFAVDNMTTSLQTLIGPKDQRVLVVSRMKTGPVKLPTLDYFITGDYQEQVVWRDAATGRLLAESDYFEPMVPNGLLTPGYGGRLYFLTGKGFIVVQVKSK
jgi:hypothetical protein